MKRNIYLLMGSALFLLGFTSAHLINKGVIEDKEMTQVGIVVDDIEAAAEAWTLFLGLDEVPAISITHRPPA